LAQALGNTVGLASPDEKAKGIERTAVEILRHYERGNKGGGKDRDAVVKLLRIREAMEAKNAGRPEVALDVRFFFLPFLFSWIEIVLFGGLGYGVDRVNSLIRGYRKDDKTGRRVQGFT